MKSVGFHKAVRKLIQDFPKEVRLTLGKAVFALQIGERLKMPLSKPVKQIDKGVEEIRIRDSSGIYRVFYLIHVKDVIIVFHAFKKKTRQTPQREIETGRQRLREMINEYK